MTNGWKETLIPPAKTQRMPGKTKGKDSYKVFLSGLCGLSEHSERARGNFFFWETTDNDGGKCKHYE